MTTNNDDLDVEAEFQRIQAEVKAKRKEQAKQQSYDDLPPNDPRRRIRDAVRAHVYCLKPVMFIRRADKEMVSGPAFDGEFNSVVNTITGLPTRYQDHAAKFAIASPALEKVQRICYRPGQPPICDGMFNMWRDPGIVPLAEKPTIFFEHMRYLFPNPHERKLALQWMAWAVQRPNEKQMFALLIVGAGGTGKSWLGKLLEVLFGEDNVSLLDDDDPLKSDFQEFKMHKRLLFVHEVAPDEKTDLVRKLKGFITESSVRINRKGIERVKIENFCNTMGITNYENALKIVRNDRRWLVVHATDDVYGVDDRLDPTKATDDYYTRLFGCIGTPDAPGDEARRILHYLGNVNLDDYNGKGLAPSTTAKDDVADAGEGKIKADVKAARDSRQGPFRYSLLTLAQVIENCVSVGRNDDPDVVLAEVASAMIEAGCRRITLASDAKVKSPQISIDGKRVRLWAVSKALAERYGRMKPGEIAEAYKAERAAEADKAASTDDDVG